MAKKRNDLAAAKKRKQKIIAIAGALLLAVLLIVQVPRTMRMLDSDAGDAAPPPPPAEAQEPTGDAPASPPVGGATSTAPSPAAQTSAADGKLIDSDLPPEPDEGDLATFERFASKDPFAPQITTTSDAAAASAPEAAAAPAPVASDTDAGTGGPPEEEWSADGGQSKPASAEFAINGKAEVVATGRAFPKAEPTFRLLAVDGDSARIGIAAGGKFTSGAKAMKLRKGKPLTFVNAEDGARYVVILLAVR